MEGEERKLGKMEELRLLVLLGLISLAILGVGVCDWLERTLKGEKNAKQK